MMDRKEIRFYAINNITQATIKDALYAVKGNNENSFKLYVSDLHGNLVPLFTSTGGGTTNITSTDGSILITGSVTKDLKISTSLQTLISSALQSGDFISTLINDAGYLTLLDLPEYGYIYKTSGESIPSYTPIAVYNNQAYKLDASNPLHQFAFAGFSVNGTILGEQCKIQQVGELTLLGWGLIPNSQYLAGTSGAMVLDNIATNNFTKVLGYATTSDTLEIIKDYTTINK
jgi:hypothetical protein